jgi:hypothetical protein
VKPCAWPQGCSQWALGDDDACTYHQRVAEGYVESTRAEGKDIVPVQLTPLQKARAEKAKRDRFEAEMARQEERRDARGELAWLHGIERGTRRGTKRHS